ncbi:LysR family transcriptional regulator [Methylibium petroleiphilum]|uniref:Transcriptional regulator-like protein n=1 Tax=Methylibium petroleiphilum (strain ATCC BAA-1232 / LMG 22953 / PM1) TaxID=420662 RepID=A2SJA4_METPP|nr:LysR family transcriptional regulator [Methylibium petroleiphilum]ABM95643.1 transcriptional regulator-like protein [Methylibium petroleiphilum PM1]
MDIEELQTFVAVADAGGVSPAAGRLGVAKSIVSRRLARLEAELGVQLLTRSTRGAAVTEAGAMFRDYAARVCAEVDAAREAILPAGELRGRLRVAAPLSFGPTHFAPVFTPDIARAIDFYARALGLRLSDRSRDAVAFMHGRHGSDHHLVAFASSSARGWHHSSWDVDGIEAVGKGGEQMRKAGYTEGWGTGRHVLGSNYFHYVRDPWGSFAEYSADIDFIATGMTWPTGDHAPEDSLYLWGPEVPDYFFHNSEA